MPLTQTRVRRDAFKFKKAGSQSPQYNHVSRQNMKNSLTLSHDEVNRD